MRLGRTIARSAAAVLPLLVAGVGVGLQGSPAAADTDPLAAAPPAVYAGDAAAQAALVSEEDERIQTIRMKASLLRWDDAKAYQSPQCDTSTPITTCVLVKRTAPYTLADLTTPELAQSVQPQSDGSLLLVANLFVTYGATLQISGSTKPLHMLSGPSGFTSIVSYGGRIELTGTASAPLSISSWDEKTRQVDRDTDDGRPYIRAIGGQLTMDFVHAEGLGFWSGKTGGIALTGTTRPNPLSAGRDESAKGKTARQAESDAAKKARQSASGGDKLGLTPASELNDARFKVLDDTSVSGRVAHSTISGDAYGLFVSGATDIAVSDTVVEKSLVDGVTLHRYVSSGKVEKTVSRDNAGHGFVLARATESIAVTQATAQGNRGDGFQLSGEPLAAGPSATGSDTRAYGNNSVSYSLSKGNGRYGIELVAGMQVTLSSNQVTGNDMGIVASGDLRTVSITGNSISGSKRQGIALRDGVSGASISGNQVSKGETGIYVRNSSAQVFGNTVRGASSHGITLVGALKGSAVTDNVLSGRGPSALDSRRADGAKISSNTTGDWIDTTGLWSKLTRLAHPTTVIWVFLLLLLAVTAARGKRARGVMGVPYADRRLTPSVTAAESAPEVGVVPSETRTLPVLGSHAIDLRTRTPAMAGVNGHGGSNGNGQNGAGHNGSARHGSNGAVSNASTSGRRDATTS